LAVESHFFVAKSPKDDHNAAGFVDRRPDAGGYWNFCCMEVIEMAKRAAKKRTARKGAAKEPLVVASKVKNYIRSKGLMCSSEAVGALSDEVYRLLDAALHRTQANRRSTVKPQDL